MMAKNIGYQYSGLHLQLIFQRQLLRILEVKTIPRGQMIKSAEEFIRLRTSEVEEEYERATNDMADISTWTEVIEKFPNYKQWVIHNKTVPVEILELLTLDSDPNVRSAVARKRKLTDKVFVTLSRDGDENVRYALMCNTNITIEKLKQIETSDSEWLTKQLKIRLQENKE